VPGSPRSVAEGRTRHYRSAPRSPRSEAEGGTIEIRRGGNHLREKDGAFPVALIDLLARSCTFSLAEKYPDVPKCKKGLHYDARENAWPNATSRKFVHTNERQQ
jgi:hypothetical protein